MPPEESQMKRFSTFSRKAKIASERWQQFIRCYTNPEICPGLILGVTSKRFPKTFFSYRSPSDPITISVDAAEILIPIEIAVPIGLVINELTSNSLKHAFPCGRAGEITITVSMEENNMKPIFKDNGIGIPENRDFKTAGTLGLKLVSMLVEQVGGKVEMIWDNGTRFGGGES